jgi:hypothetical protein
VQVLLRHGAAPAQGPPGSLPSPAQDDGSNKENVSP